MKDNKIYGFIGYENNRNPFIFTENILTILPKSEVELKTRTDELFREIIKDMNEPQSEKDWIKNEYLNGITHDGSNITFLTKGMKSSDNGIIIYKVQAYYETTEADANCKINELLLTSDDIDLFYNPSRIFNKKIYSDENKTNKVEVNTNKIEEENVGYYIYDNVKIHFSIGISYRLHSLSKKPLDSYSYFHLNFEEEKDFDWTLNIINHFNILLKYLHYRRNIIWKDISILENKNKRPKGHIFILNNLKNEENKKKERYFIRYEYLKDNIIILINEIAQKKMYIHHIHQKIDDRYKIDVNRIIVLFAAFEREFKNYYSDFKRSELFFNKKNEVITILNNNITECKNRKERKYVERFITCIENSDYSLGACLKHALNDCEDIIKVFVQSIYNKYDNDLINDISERMNLLRNNIAHGKLDFEIEPLNISDIQILEVLLYAIRLNKLNLDCKLKKKSIVDLLGYNIAV